MDIQDWEKDAAHNAGRVGGEYLESVGVFDISKLTKEQWETFLECVCMAYEVEKVKLSPPF